MSRRIKFAESCKTDKLDFQNGEYRREFDRKNEPFDVTEEEWRVLRRTNCFEPAAPPASQADADDNSQQQHHAEAEMQAAKAQDNEQSDHSEE